MSAILLVIVAITLIALVIVGQFHRRQLLEQVGRELLTARDVVQSDLANRQSQLARSAMVLAQDFGLKSAVATQDRTTAKTVLINHGSRVGAALAMVADTRGEVVVVADENIDLADWDSTSFNRMLAPLRSNRTVHSMDVFGSRIYQLVAAPILAPEPVGYLVLGFEIDQSKLGTLSELTRSGIGIISPKTGQTIIASEGLETVVPQWHGQWSPSGPEIQLLTLETMKFLVARSAFQTSEPATIELLVGRDMDAVLLPAEELNRTMIWTALVAVVIGTVLAALVSHDVVKPILQVRKMLEGASRTANVNERDARLLEDADSQQIARSIVELQGEARTDQLTGLPNRAAALADLGDRIANEPGVFAVLLFDLDRFKQVNDNLGHQAGDLLLAAVAQRSQALLSSSENQVSRLGGDEFLVVLGNCDRAAAQSTIERLVDVLIEPYRVDDMWAEIGVSIGVAMYPQSGQDGAELLRRADVAMYHAKRAGDNFAFFEPEQEHADDNDSRLVHDLRTALDQGDVELFYQPCFDINIGQLVSVEVLARWFHPERGLIDTATVLATAERIGLMRDLSNLVLRRGFQAAADFARSGIVARVHINLSALDLIDPQLNSRIKFAARFTHCQPEQLAIEFDESIIASNLANAPDLLRRLRHTGVHLVLDNFSGTRLPPSALASLRFSEIKVSPEITDEIRPAMIRMITDIGMTATLVAPPSSGALAVTRWRENRYSRVQGDALAEPMEKSDFIDWALDLDDRPAAIKSARRSGRVG